MKRLFLALAALLLLGGCVLPVTSNSEKNLAQLPYTFKGTDGDWEVAVEFRELSDDDHALIERMREDGVELEGDLSEGYRSAVRIRYTGSETIESLTYTFGLHTRWSSLLEVTEENAEMPVADALNGQVELGGNFFTPDGSIGGPLPPKGYKGLQVLINATTESGETLSAQIRILTE